MPKTPRLLIRDRDRKFSRDFDEVFRSERMRVIKAPVRAPKARAQAERPGTWSISIVPAAETSLAG